MSPFEIYLRTGRITPKPEVKINYRHDEETGEFARRNEGRYWGPGGSIYDNHSANRMARRPPKNGGGYGGFGGGGGGFGGGGASGSWDAPKPKPEARQAPNRHSAKAPPVIAARTTGQAPQRPRPFTPVQKNGYTYQIDDLHRSRDINGELQNGPPGERSRRTGLQAGRPDRRPTDDGGHYIARRFNGPRDAFNHFAQDRNFNRGAYREMERLWAMEIAAGRKVNVRITPKYHGDSQRPSSIRVISTINGKKVIRNFPNEPSGGRNGR